MNKAAKGFSRIRSIVLFNLSGDGLELVATVAVGGDNKGLEAGWDKGYFELKGIMKGVYGISLSM